MRCAVDVEGMSTNAETRVMAPIPVPSPNSAVPIGSPIAMSDPNANSRMTIAASTPMASVAPSEGRVAARGISPPKSTVSPAAVAGRVAPCSWSNVDVGSRSGPRRT